MNLTVLLSLPAVSVPPLKPGAILPGIPRPSLLSKITACTSLPASSPTQQAFEVQFHTLDSFNLKNGQLHSLYEQCRVLSPSDPMVAQLNDEMFALSESLQKPLNINEVLNK